MVHYEVIVTNKTKLSRQKLTNEIARQCKEKEIFFYFHHNGAVEDTRFCLGLPEDDKKHDTKMSLAIKILKSLGIEEDAQFKVKDEDGLPCPKYNKKNDKIINRQ